MLQLLGCFTVLSCIFTNHYSCNFWLDFFLLSLHVFCFWFVLHLNNLFPIRWLTTDFVSFAIHNYFIWFDHNVPFLGPAADHSEGANKGGKNPEHHPDEANVVCMANIHYVEYSSGNEWQKKPCYEDLLECLFDFDVHYAQVWLIRSVHKVFWRDYDIIDYVVCQWLLMRHHTTFIIEYDVDTNRTV